MIKKFNRFKKNMVAYVFILPFIIGLAILFIPAMVQSLVFSFNVVRISPMDGGIVMEPAGWANFDRALNIDVAFREVMINVLTEMAINLPIILVFSFLAAIILNQKFKGRGLVRAVFFVPVIIATGIIARIDAGDLIMSMYSFGAMGASSGDSLLAFIDMQALVMFLQSLGLGVWVLDYVMTAIDRLYIVVLRSGVQILIFLSALQSVPVSLYEASHVEGCSGWESFWKITLPMVSPIIMVNVVYTIIASFLDSTNPMMDLIRSTMFARGLFGLGSSMAWAYFAAASVLLIVVSFLVSRLVVYNE